MERWSADLRIGVLGDGRNVPNRSSALLDKPRNWREFAVLDFVELIL